MVAAAKRFESVFDYILVLLFATAVSASGTAHARSVDEALHDIENRWAHAVYEATGREKSKALVALLQDVRKFASGHADNPAAAAWHGVVARECTQSHCRSNPSKLRREARDALQKAESLKPGALGGLVYAHLGALYTDAPSAFGGFGSKVRGIGYMWKAIIVDPDGLDANYLYAELLIGEDRFGEARDILLRASSAGVRPDHERADIGRQRQAQVLLRKVEARLGRST